MEILKGTRTSRRATHQLMPLRIDKQLVHIHVAHQRTVRNLVHVIDTLRIWAAEQARLIRGQTERIAAPTKLSRRLRVERRRYELHGNGIWVKRIPCSSPSIDGHTNGATCCDIGRSSGNTRARGTAHDKNRLSKITRLGHGHLKIIATVFDKSSLSHSRFA